MDVSVIIPLYNGQAFIRRAIDSVFKQTHLPAELIIVDDASTDDSLRRAAEAAIGAPIPVRIFRMTENSGSPVKPLNTGVREARGVLIAPLDQDDYFFSEKLEKMQNALAQERDVRLVFSDFLGISRLSSLEILEGHHWLHEKLTRQPGTSQVLLLDSLTALYGLLRYVNLCPSFSSMLFYRSDFEEKGGLDENFKIAADYDFICRMAVQHKIAYVEKAFFYKQLHEENLSYHPIRHVENSTVFLNYLWQAQSIGVRVSGADMQKKTLNRWGLYAAHCRENKNYHAPLALNLHALNYFKFNFMGLKAMLRLWGQFLLKRYFSNSPKHA